MSWLLKYANPDGSNEQTVNLSALGALEGGQVSGEGIKFTFSSHKASEVNIDIPNVNPINAPAISFTGRIRILDNNGVQQFVGRRIDWDGNVSANNKGFKYQFQDAWWDLSKLTFKQVWWSGAYVPVTVSGNVVTLPSQYSFVSIGPLNSVVAFFYDTNKNQVGANWTISGENGPPVTSFNVSGGTGTANGALYMALQAENTDVVLFQYYPGNPYQNSGQVTNYYITTGAQIIEILNFAIARGVQLQVGEIDPALYVPWYPVRAQNCAECLKVCLRDHPDCFTEIDYSTTPPTFNVRNRANLTPKTLPYAYTDINGIQHLSTEIKPRPDLIPSRIGIFYRYLINGQTVAFPTDIYPVNAPDSLLALDYTIDLQGPRMSVSYGNVQSVIFDPSPATFAANQGTPATCWWLQKSAGLKSPDIQNLSMVNPDGSNISGNPVLVLMDDNVSPIDLTYYKWELVGGSQALWMSGVSVVSANVTAWFSYNKKTASGALDGVVKAHPVTVRVNLVNTASIQQAYSQAITSGEAIPNGLAQNIYTSLQTMQYNLRQSQKEEPFTSFIKPGKHSININGGNSAWASMNATVQETTYTLHQRPDGVVWGTSDVSCGPVEHLEAGQLVQLFNIFNNRDLTKIDPWERITGTANSGGASSNGTTAKENSEPGVPAHSLSTHVNGTATSDATGGTSYSTFQPDVRTSGLQIFKWDGSSLAGDGTRQPKSTTPGYLLLLTDIATIIATHTTVTPVSPFTADDIWKLKAREVNVCDSSGTIHKAIVLISGMYDIT